MAAKPKNLNKFCYVEVEMNNETTMEMIDLGAIQNYIAARRVVELRLKVQPGTSSFKAVNSPTKRVTRVVKEVAVKVAKWQGHMDLMA